MDVHRGENRQDCPRALIGDIERKAFVDPEALSAKVVDPQTPGHKQDW